MRSLKPASKAGLEQQASAKMKPPCSTNSRRFCWAMALNSGAWWPLKKTMGAWSRSATLAEPGSTTCQVSRLFQSRETTETMLRTSSVSLFQSFRGPCRSLLTSTGARPLARNKSAKLVATTGLSTEHLARSPRAGSGSWTSSSAPRRYQSLRPKNADSREPAGAFQAVEVVMLPLLAHAEVLADAEVGRHPVDAAPEVGVEAPLAAVVNQRSLEDTPGPGSACRR